MTTAPDPMAGARELGRRIRESGLAKCPSCDQVGGHHLMWCESQRLTKRYDVEYQETAAGRYVVAVRFEMPAEAKTEQMDTILSDVLPDVMARFTRKHAEYGDQLDDDLGARGHFADISRKVKKLRRYMWDGVPVPEGAESVEQIQQELIGHLLFALYWGHDAP